MNTAIELKPCPSCGGAGKLHKKKNKYWVECDGDCWTQTGKYFDAYLAVDEWNSFERRADNG